MGGWLAEPDFGPEGATDFNDLASRRGLGAVKDCIEAAKLPPALAKHGVSGVSGVQPNNDEAYSDTPACGEGVSGVSATAINQLPEKTKRPAFRVFDDWIGWNMAG